MAPHQCKQCACSLDDDDRDLCDACKQGATSTPNQPGTDVISSQTQSSHIPPGQTDPRTLSSAAGSASVTGDHDAGDGASVSDIFIAGFPYGTDARLAIVGRPWCWRPHHKKCVISDAYACDTCRLIPEQIKNMSRTIDMNESLTKLVTANKVLSSPKSKLLTIRKLK